MKRCGSSPSIASPVTGSVLSSAASSSGRPDSPSTTRECLMASAKTWSLLGSARSLARVSSSRLRKVSAATSGLSRSGSENTDVEGDHDGAEPGQFGDEVGDPRARPRPLPELFQALFVDIDDGDRPCGLLARIDALEGVEGPDPNLLDRSRIGDAQRGKPDQQRKAQQPGIADAPLEPPW